jgi:hypothetical protein
VHPQVGQVSTHPFEDVVDGGPWCDACGLPRSNKRHREPSALPAVDSAARVVGQIGPDTPATSTAAAALTAPRAGSLRAEIVGLIAGARHGLTDDELERITGRTHQSVSASRNGLAADGWVRALTDRGTPVTRTTRTGSDAQAWVLTQEGRASWK